MRIFCFGNPDIKEDRLALELADELAKDKALSRDFEFIKCTSPDFLLDLDEKESKEVIIIDVVKGLNKLEMITDLDELNDTKMTTLHDFDLGTVLKLMKGAGHLNKIRIIGLPQNGDKNIIKEKITDLLKEF